MNNKRHRDSGRYSRVESYEHAAFRTMKNTRKVTFRFCIECTPVPIKFLTVSAAELWHTSCIPCRVTEKRDKSS